MGEMAICRFVSMDQLRQVFAEPVRAIVDSMARVVHSMPQEFQLQLQFAFEWAAWRQNKLGSENSFLCMESIIESIYNFVREDNRS